MAKRKGHEFPSASRNDRSRRAKPRILNFQQLESRSLLSVVLPLATVGDRCLPAAVAGEPAALVGAASGTPVAATTASGAAANTPATLVGPQATTPAVVAAAPIAPEAYGPAVAAPPAVPMAAAKVQTDAYVIFWENNNRVGAGVPVRMYNSNGTLVATKLTDSKGRVHFDSVPGGLYKLTAEFSYGGKSFYGQIQAKSRFSGPINAQWVVTKPPLKPVEGSSSLQVTVRDAKDRHDVAGAKVRVLKDGKVYAEYMSNSKGRVNLWDLPKGTYGVEVVYGGKTYTPSPKSVKLTGGSSSRWTPIVRLR